MSGRAETARACAAYFALTDEMGGRTLA